jgi:thioredoxin-like negative regulator of GroEL
LRSNRLLKHAITRLAADKRGWTRIENQADCTCPSASISVYRRLNCIFQPRAQNLLPGFLLLTGFLLLAAPAFAADAEEVHWYSTIEEASARAVPSNRPIMIDFWAAWCAPCKVMEKEVYSTAEFQQATERFLPVKIDFDKKTALARKYNVEALPTIVFADSYGNELFRYRGYVGAKTLLELVRALPGDVTDFNRLNQILRGDANNLDALESMGKSLREAGLFRASNDYYAKAARRPEHREAILPVIGQNFLEVEDSKLAAETFEKCLKEFPSSGQRPAWMLKLARAYALGGKNDRARKALQTLLREHPAAAEAGDARKLLEGGR